MNKKLIASAAALVMTVQTFSTLTASAADSITASAVLNGTNTEVTLSAAAEKAVNVYAASYESGILKTVSAGSIAAGDISVMLDNVSEGARIYIWYEDQSPVCDPVTLTADTEEKPTETETDEPISLFDFNAVTSINGRNTSGIAPAEISASEDGTAVTALTLNTIDYTTTAGDSSYAAVLAPVTGWGENPYVQVKLSAEGYSDLTVSAAVGATKKGPATYKLQYSTDGESFIDAGDTYTLAGNKTLYQAFDKVALTGADDAETLYIRIVPVGTETVGGTVALSGTSGEYAVNNIKIYGTANGRPTAVPAATEEPEVTEAVQTEKPAGDGIIHLNETSIDAAGIDGTAVSGTTLTISSGGEYTIEGTLTDGQIVTNANEAVTLKLSGVNVTSSASSALRSSNGAVTIATAADTENTFTSAAGSAIESSKDLTIKGEGTLNAISTTGNGIRCKADLEIGAGDINITAYNNGIKGDNSVKITKKATNITVNAQTGDAIKSDAISTDAATGKSTMETGKGTVTINGGTLNLTAPGNDGIQADNTLTIAGGTITINTGANGIKANEYNITEIDADGTALGTVINGAIIISGGTLDITSVEEAIRAAEKLDITGEETTITVAVTGEDQDAVKAGKNTDTVEGTTTTTTVDVKGIINISNGTLTILKSADDAVVSMGDVNITGGTVKSGTGTSDIAGDFFKVYDNFIMSGGTLDLKACCDGIQAGKALTVTVSGTTELDSNYTEGNVNITGGTINITANEGSAKRSHTAVQALENSCKGIKANTYLDISGGDITINAADDAIHSNWNVTITGGTMNLATDDDGVHADYMLTLGTDGGADDDFSIDISYSYEGVEGSVINLLSGTTTLYSTDDGVNAAGDYQEGAVFETVSDENMTVSAGPGGMTGPGGPGGTGGNTSGPSNPGGNRPGEGDDDSSSYGMLYIKGGVTFCEVGGDGLDSNGDINMSGGVAIVNGPTSGGNGVFDKGDNNTFTVTGGTLVGVGSNDMQDNPTQMSQGCYSSTGSVTKGASFKIMTDNGYIAVTPKITLSNALIYVSSSDMTSGKSYSKTSTTGSETGTQYGKTENGTFYGILIGTN